MIPEEQCVLERVKILAQSPSLNVKISVIYTEHVSGSWGGKKKKTLSDKVKVRST